MSGGGGGGQETTTSSEPWEGVRRHLRDLYDRGAALSQSQDLRPFGALPMQQRLQAMGELWGGNPAEIAQGYGFDAGLLGQGPQSGGGPLGPSPLPPMAGTPPAAAPAAPQQPAAGQPPALIPQIQQLEEMGVRGLHSGLGNNRGLTEEGVRMIMDNRRRHPGAFVGGNWIG